MGGLKIGLIRIEDPKDFFNDESFPGSSGSRVPKNIGLASQSQQAMENPRIAEMDLGRIVP
jgi:hypothetical protein